MPAAHARRGSPNPVGQQRALDVGALSAVFVCGGVLGCAAYHLLLRRSRCQQTASCSELDVATPSPAGADRDRGAPSAADSSRSGESPDSAAVSGSCCAGAARLQDDCARAHAHDRERREAEATLRASRRSVRVWFVRHAQSESNVANHDRHNGACRRGK